MMVPETSARGLRSGPTQVWSHELTWDAGTGEGLIGFQFNAEQSRRESGERTERRYHIYIPFTIVDGHMRKALLAS